jgi:hypothetical protein
MTSLLLLMGLVCLTPVFASLSFVVFSPSARTHRGLVGSLGALFGFLLGLIAAFCGVMLPVSSIGLSSQPTKGADSLIRAVGLEAGIAALAAALLAIVVTRLMARAIAHKEGSQ